MKRLKLLFLSSFIMLFFAACELSSPDATVSTLEGREPEVITWISGRQWFPATIGILVHEQEGSPGYIYLEANSSANKGYKRVLRLNIIDNDIDWLPLDTLNLLATELPTRVSVEYEQFRDRDNQSSSIWLGDSNDRGGIHITRLEEEDGVLYAAGEFFMTPYVFNNRPDIQEIEGIFNNVRVFESRADMDDYFRKVTALEAASN